MFFNGKYVDVLLVMVSIIEMLTTSNFSAIKASSSTTSTATHLYVQSVFGGKESVVKIGDIGKKILDTVLSIFRAVIDSLLSRWVSVNYLCL